ncbi:MAG: hypothetical protein LBR30_05105 [Clostridioides sp.]|nr:hypothetical protein [Clostridioides sp.]
MIETNGNKDIKIYAISDNETKEIKDATINYDNTTRQLSVKINDLDSIKSYNPNGSGSGDGSN